MGHRVSLSRIRGERQQWGLEAELPVHAIHGEMVRVYGEPLKLVSLYIHT